MKLLIVDLDPIARENLQRAVQLERRCEISTADDFAAGWATLTAAERPFDAVFIDPYAADGKGSEWLRRVRETHWAQPFAIVYCGLADRAAVAGATDLGVRHFVFKPFSSTSIAAKLRQIETSRAYFRIEPSFARREWNALVPIG